MTLRSPQVVAHRVLLELRAALATIAGAKVQHPDAALLIEHHALMQEPRVPLDGARGYSRAATLDDLRRLGIGTMPQLEDAVARALLAITP